MPPLHELSRRMRAQTGRWLELATHAIADPDHAKEELIRRIVRERLEQDRAGLEEGAEAGLGSTPSQRALDGLPSLPGWPDGGPSRAWLGPAA